MLRRYRKIVGLTILSFGLGVLLTFFLPIAVLIVIEAVVLVALGLLFIQC